MKIYKDIPNLNGRLLNPATMEWSYVDRSGKVSESLRLARENFRFKWKLLHSQGKVDVDQMFKEAKELELT